MIDQKAEICEKLKSVFLQELDKKSFDLYIESFSVVRDNPGKKTKVLCLVKDFIEGSKQALLLLGDSGTGKTLLSTKIAQQLWQDKKTEYWPIYIYLPTLLNEEGYLKPNLLETHLKNKCYLEKKEIAFLKTKKIKLLLILDGFDEVKWKGNIILLNGLDKWQVKLLCTCRPEALQLYQDYQQYFCYGEKYKPREELLTETTLCSFTTKQIDVYCLEYLKTLPEEEYNKLPKQWQNLETYQHYLKILPGLMDLVQNPFILSMVVQALPTIVEKQKLHNIIKNNYQNNEQLSTEQQHLTRMELYRCFTRQWLDTQASRLQKKQGLSLNYLKGSLAEYLAVYAKNLAIQQLQAGKLDPILTPKETSKNYLLIPTEKELLECYEKHDREFLEENIKDIRGSCLLKTHGKVFRFLHKSLLEYLAAEELLREALGLLQVGFYNNERNHSRKKYYAFQEELLVDEPEIIARLAEVAQWDKNFKKSLWAIVEASKEDGLYTTAAANAITVWHKAGFNLAGVDLKNARLCGADLRNAVLICAQLDGADLKNVRLHGANLSLASLRDADLTGVQFGQWPILLTERINDFAFEPENSLSKNRVAVSSGCYVYVYQIDSGKLVKRLDNWSFWRTGFYSPGTYNIIWHSQGQLATNSTDGYIRLWDMQNYQCLWILKAYEMLHQSHIGMGNISYHPSSQLLVSAQSVYKSKHYNNIRLWDTKTGIELKVLEYEKIDPFTCISYSPNGAQLAVSMRWNYSTDYIYLLDSVSRESQKILRDGHTNKITCIQYNPNGLQLASGSKDTTICLWDVKSGKKQWVLQWHSKSVSSVVFRSDGKQLASGSEDETICLWDVATGTKQRVLQNSCKVRRLSYYLNGKLLTSNGQHGIHFWEISSSNELMKEHSHLVKRLSFRPDGLQFVFSQGDSLGNGKNFRIFIQEIMKRKPQFMLQGHQYPVVSVLYSPNGQQLASIDSFKIILWDVINGKEQRVLEHGSDYASIHSLSYRPDGQQLASGGDDKTVRLWNMTTGKEHLMLQGGHTRNITCIDYSPDGKLLVSGGEDSNICLWNAGNGKLLKVLTGHVGYLTYLKFRPDGLQLASVEKYGDDTIRLWNLTNYKCLQVLRGYRRITGLTYSPNGEYLASGDSAHFVYLWDTINGNCLAKINLLDFSVLALQFTTNSRLLLGYENCIFVELEWQEKVKQFKILQISNNSSMKFHCFDTKIDNSYGLSENNLKVLKQHGALGKPSTEKYWSRGISSALFKNTAPRKQALQNIVGGKVELNQFFGAVSLVRSKDHNHAFFLLEVATNCGHSIFYADLRTSSTLLEQSFSQAKAKITLKLWKDDLNFSKLRQKVKEEFVYQTFPVKMENMKKLHANIEQDKHKKIYYSMDGGGSFSVSGRTYRNCMTWCEDKLKEIDIKLPDKWLKSPKLYLPEINIDEKDSSVKQCSNQK